MFFALSLGLLIGSFLNVCIYRIPRQMSVVYKRSRCVSCGRPLSPAELIPLLSFLLQRGRCRGCGEGISLQYPLVEGWTALTFAALAALYGGLTAAWAAAALMAAFFIVIAVIDLQHKIIPNRVLGAAFVAIALRQAGKVWTGQDGGLALLLDSLAGGVFGAALLFAVFWFSKGGLGLGDVKFAFVFGLLLGWPGALWAITLSALCGSVVGLAGIASGRWTGKSQIPFGPFLAFGYFTVYLLLESSAAAAIRDFLG
ncbi:peptidase a24a, prepilin type iv peptidase [Heliomicrobium modesticaldum Ice1]|uniref:Peptidase a24a, prepilin type iv peptidase n=1 Tax=Heliobacterium modesticaldum (strain ATCC 51547 / Ice1) TaxID=498761 RepID=B0TEF3_HELMI|nr:A24 family peptidase [Heliomicrobium modesticaldum]ABZ82872.1 peptidase a24a, prepilin type iv peptidase [Heliomicrobium modesticaldum Ice1]